MKGGTGASITAKRRWDQRNASCHRDNQWDTSSAVFLLFSRFCYPISSPFRLVRTSIFSRGVTAAHSRHSAPQPVKHLSQTNCPHYSCGGSSPLPSVLCYPASGS